MTAEEREGWRARKGERVAIAYDPPSHTAVIVGVRVAPSYPSNDKVMVRFDDGSRLAVWPHQVT